MIELAVSDDLPDPYQWRPVRDTLRARRCYAARNPDRNVATLAPYVGELKQYLARPLRRITRGF